MQYAWNIEFLPETSAKATLPVPASNISGVPQVEDEDERELELLDLPGEGLKKLRRMAHESSMSGLGTLRCIHLWDSYGSTASICLQQQMPCSASLRAGSCLRGILHCRPATSEFLIP
ncbi:hypothetical protein BS78_09G118300 [Paspalum vaginatum]|nr:hypothetical protein BS78_09G118300 [Paspalum vaginatum]